ncbi:MAG: hypothetical protein ACO241_11290, partial [Burkholderiaceae bacterium]
MYARGVVCSQAVRYAATTVVRNVFTHPTETAIQKAGAGARKTAGTTIDAETAKMMAKALKRDCQK